MGDISTSCITSMINAFIISYCLYEIYRSGYALGRLDTWLKESKVRKESHVW